MLNTAFNIHNSVLGKTGVREWRLDYSGSVPLSEIIFDETGNNLKTNVDRGILGQACVGDRIEVFTDGHSTGVFLTIISGSQDYCTCVTCGKNEDVFLLSDGAKLGTMSIGKKLSGYNGSLSSVVVVPLGTTSIETQLDFSVDGHDVGSIVVNANTASGTKIVLSIGAAPGLLSIAPNVITNDKTPCAVYVVGERKEILSNVSLLPGEKSRSVSVSDVGNTNVKIGFNGFVRIKRIAVIPDEQNVNVVTFKTSAVNGNEIPCGGLVLANNSPVGIPVYGSLMNYVTESVHFEVTAGVASATKAKVVFVYEELGSCVEYQYNIPNANVATSPYAIPDVFDATISSALFSAKPVGALWDKGNFTVTLANGANNVAANVDCSNATTKPPLVNNVLTADVNGLHLTNVTTGGSTNPVNVRLLLLLS
jgi:hypothetical protein